jgi:hypothetical protein
MESTIRAGRIIGVLIIIQMVGSSVVNFSLEEPLFGTQGFLLNAASHSQQVGLAAVLGLIIELLWVGIAITAFPVFKQRTPAMALWLVVLAGVVLAVAVVENAAMMSMVSLSEAYAKASPAEHAQLETIRVVVAAARNWPHFLARIFDGLTIFVFCADALSLRTGSAGPRGLWFDRCLADDRRGCPVSLFGHDVIFPMLAPLGLSQLVLAVWLMTKGFRGQPGGGIEPREF